MKRSISKSKDILNEVKQKQNEEDASRNVLLKPTFKQTSTVRNAKNEVPTLLRIKRKNVSASASENEESFEKILNLCVMKKMKFTQENTKVFSFFKTVSREENESLLSAKSDTRKLNFLKKDETAAESFSFSTFSGGAPATHRVPIKKPFYQPPSISHVKQILSSKMVQKAKDTRYRLRDEKRKQQIIQDGIMYNVVDIEKDDGIDPLTRSLESMTQEFLKLNSSESQSQKSLDEEDVSYDLYIYNHDAALTDVLNSGLVGTLEMDDDDTLYLEDEATASDIGSDSDSNAEDYYKNEYPEEELSDEENRYPRIYASSQDDSESGSDFY